jgi:hypothetical protein
MASIVFNKTIKRKVENISFDTLPVEVLSELFKDGRIFSHFMERILAKDYGLTHVPGCKGHDIVDPLNPDIKYEQKTFTGNGCKFMPSNMIGQGRHFDKSIFDEKSKHLIYIIVSNVNFPLLKIQFVKGPELSARYPNGEIRLKDYDSFFTDE